MTSISQTLQSFHVDNMKCAGCASSIKEALAVLANTEVIDVSIDDKLVRIKTDKQAAEVATVISQAGFSARVTNS